MRRDRIIGSVPGELVMNVSSIDCFHSLLIAQYLEIHTNYYKSASWKSMDFYTSSSHCRSRGPGYAGKAYLRCGKIDNNPLEPEAAIR